MLPTEWAEKNRVLPDDTPRPGRMSYKDFPYLVEIANRGAPADPTQIIINMKGAQTGATVGVEETNMGYSIAVDPSPMMYVTGTNQLATDSVKSRIDPMISNSGLSDFISSQSIKKANKNTGDTATMKEFPGGFLKIGSLQSPSTGRSLSAKKLFIDETDAAKTELGKEGSTILTFMKRTNAFENSKKVFMVSTPGEMEGSIIHPEYLKGDQRKYFVPCPKCGHMQYLQWGQFRYKLVDKILDYDSVGYECENMECRQLWKNHEKINFLKLGEWRATAKAKKRFTVSYHLPAFYSPVGFLSWESIVEQWVEAQVAMKNGDIMPLKAFVLTVMGEPWEERGEAPKHELIMLKRDNHNYTRGTVPEEVLFLTLGADVQGNRVEAELVGWGKRMQSFSINHFVLMCKKDEATGQIESITDLNGNPWKMLENIITGAYSTPSNRQLNVLQAFIDARWKPATVKEFCTKITNTYPCMGEGGNKTWGRPFRAKEIKEAPGIRFDIDTHGLKEHIYTLLRRGVNDDGTFPNGSCFFPTDYPEKYFRQLVAEEKKNKRTKAGKIVTEWAKRPGFERNEALDIRVYAMAALYKIAAYVCEECFNFDGISWEFFWDYMEKEFNPTE